MTIIRYLLWSVPVIELQMFQPSLPAPNQTNIKQHTDYTGKDLRLRKTRRSFSKPEALKVPEKRGSSGSGILTSE